jgi:hypothetical protein
MCDNSGTDNPEHVHTDECPEFDASVEQNEELLTKLNEPASKLTESQFRELRGKYFTVRHLRVKECGHLLDQINEPTFRNCEYCWFFFLESHPELVRVADEAYIEHGAAFIDKLRGRKFRVMFARFMATKLAMKMEMEARNAANTEPTESNIRAVDSDQPIRQTGQSE